MVAEMPMACSHDGLTVTREDLTKRPAPLVCAKSTLKATNWTERANRLIGQKTLQLQLLLKFACSGKEVKLLQPTAGAVTSL